MRARTRRRLGRFLKRRLITIFLLFLAIGGFIWTNVHLQGQKNAEISATIRRADEEKAVMDKQIADIIAARKAAEEKARKEREEREARETAKKVISGAPANTIDATTCNRATTHKNPASIDVLVNKKHCLQPVSFAPRDLTSVYGATISQKAAADFTAMYNAARAAGQGFTVTSSYRSYADQVSTYNYWVSVSGVAGADTYSARPGYSEHQTGLAVDLASPAGCSLDCFGSTSQYKWLQANAHKYGFIQRYYAGQEAVTGYKAEEWHYRYVGKAVAQDMRGKGIKTLEAYWGFPGGTYY